MSRRVNLPVNNDMIVRQQITRWFEAVAACDLDGVLADHDPDVVQFDVGPPHDGVRGIDAYRETWPCLFEYLNTGARFELLELDVTAGTDVAFVRALSRSGTEADFAANPDTRLRSTIGLRRDGDRWTVIHEHHSYCMT